MYEDRIRRVLEALEQMGLEQMIVSDPDSIWYLTGYYVHPFERLFALYLRRDGKHKFFLNKLFFHKFFFNLLKFFFDSFFHNFSYFVCKSTHNRSFFCGKFAHLFKNCCNFAFFAKNTNTDIIDFCRCCCICNLFETQLTNVFKLLFHFVFSLFFFVSVLGRRLANKKASSLKSIRDEAYDFSYSVVPPKFPHIKRGHSRPFNARNTAMPS